MSKKTISKLNFSKDMYWENLKSKFLWKPKYFH
jgi:hypothetical protein